MTKPIASFDDFLSLLTQERELFRYPVADLVERYRDIYKRDATFILQALEAFAKRQGHTLPDVLTEYANYVRQAADEYRSYQNRGKYATKSETELKSLFADNDFKAKYLYILTASTLINRSRYELRLNYQQAVREHIEPNSAILEIGGGNCLDALYTSQYGHVDVFELNEHSLVWHDILNLKNVNLKIQPYDFSDQGKYDFVCMAELLEHVSNPSEYLDRAYKVLRNDGAAYVTFAIRMPQFDHLYEFDSIEECKSLLHAARFKIIEDFCTISTYHPFPDEERWKLAGDPNYAVIYCCVVQKQQRDELAGLIDSFNAEFDNEELTT